MSGLWDFRYLPAPLHTLSCTAWSGCPCDCREPQPTTADLPDRVDTDPADPESGQS